MPTGNSVATAENANRYGSQRTHARREVDISADRPSTGVSSARPRSASWSPACCRRSRTGEGS
ncbi:hypothetical protein ACFQ0T_29645 [Kitasatospora gansuensis]